MSNIIKESVENIQTVGLKVFCERGFQYAIFKFKRKWHGYDKENTERFHHLKDKYKGKRIFVLGNGPSINKQPLYLLRDEYKMCFNRFQLLADRVGWYPDLLAITDDLVVKDMGDVINGTIVPNVKYAFFPDLHPSNVNYKDYIKQQDNVYWLYVDKTDFSVNLPFCGINKTVVNAGIQIAAYMGFSEIYILGVDMTFGQQKVEKVNSRVWVSKEDDPNHFDPRYYQKGRVYHNPTVDSMLDRFEKCRDFFADKDVKIYNAGFGGKLEAFPRVRFEDVLGKSEEEQKKLFLNALHQINPKAELDDFKPYLPDDVNEGNFFIQTDEGVKLIKEKIYSHIPFGPYHGNYYFMKRNKI